MEECPTGLHQVREGSICSESGGCVVCWLHDRQAGHFVAQRRRKSISLSRHVGYILSQQSQVTTMCKLDHQEIDTSNCFVCQYCLQPIASISANLARRFLVSSRFNQTFGDIGRVECVSTCLKLCELVQHAEACCKRQQIFNSLCSSEQLAEAAPAIHNSGAEDFTDRQSPTLLTQNCEGEAFDAASSRSDEDEDDEGLPFVPLHNPVLRPTASVSAVSDTPQIAAAWASNAVERQNNERGWCIHNVGWDSVPQNACTFNADVFAESGSLSSEALAKNGKSFIIEHSNPFAEATQRVVGQTSASSGADACGDTRFKRRMLYAYRDLFQKSLSPSRPRAARVEAAVNRLDDPQYRRFHHLTRPQLRRVLSDSTLYGNGAKGSKPHPVADVMLAEWQAAHNISSTAVNDLIHSVFPRLNYVEWMAFGHKNVGNWTKKLLQAREQALAGVEAQLNQEAISSSANNQEESGSASDLRKTAENFGISISLLSALSDLLSDPHVLRRIAIQGAKIAVRCRKKEPNQRREFKVKVRGKRPNGGRLHSSTDEAGIAVSSENIQEFHENGEIECNSRFLDFEDDPNNAEGFAAITGPYSAYLCQRLTRTAQRSGMDGVLLLHVTHDTTLVTQRRCAYPFLIRISSLRGNDSMNLGSTRMLASLHKLKSCCAEDDAKAINRLLSAVENGSNVVAQVDSVRGALLRAAYALLQQQVKTFYNCGIEVDIPTPDGNVQHALLRVCIGSIGGDIPELQTLSGTGARQSPVCSAQHSTVKERMAADVQFCKVLRHSGIVPDETDELITSAHVKLDAMAMGEEPTGNCVLSCVLVAKLSAADDDAEFWGSIAVRCVFDELHIIKEGMCKAIWKNINLLVGNSHCMWRHLFKPGQGNQQLGRDEINDSDDDDDESSVEDEWDNERFVSENAEWGVAVAREVLELFDGKDTPRVQQTTKDKLLLRFHERMQQALSRNQSCGRRLSRKLHVEAWTQDRLQANDYLMIMLALPAVIGCKGAVIADAKREASIQLLLANVSHATIVRL